MEFLPYIMKWLEVVLRWGHVLFAILWVGNSFLFNYLDNNLNKNITSGDIDGEGYLMHSGFFYKLSRLKTSPPQDYLNRLVIFKWQSYLTFVTGILLLVVIYYYNAGVLMVDKRVLLISPSYAIIISLLSLIISWFVYDLLCKSKLIENNILFISTAIILLALVSFGLTKLFGPKFAILSVGLIIGTNMFGNVFTVIIPNQMNIIKSSLKNKKIDSSLYPKLRLLETDTQIVVPVNKVVKLQITSADVLHAWTIPAFGVKMDAVPGRLNETWFKANKEGIYYGQCSELCAPEHAFRPITVLLVSKSEFHDWLDFAE